MTVAAGTSQTFAAIGNREDLEDFIYNISPTDTPFMSRAGRGKATAVFHEWQTEALAAAVATNAAIEGDDATNTTVVATTRLGNYAQIAQYAFGVSGTQQAVTRAGIKDEMAHQLVVFGKRMKRDMESQLTQNKASSAGGAGTARTAASVESWISTNWTSLGSGGSPSSSGFQSGIVAAPTDNSAQGTVTEAGVKAIIRAAWTQGGSPDTIMVGPFNRTKVSAFAGIATPYNPLTGAKPAAIVASADIYVSDFGKLTVVANRFQRDRTLLILDFDYWSIAYLRPMQKKALAKTGDADRMQILAEYTLVSKQEAASGKVADLTTS
ncbi:MAG TPA: DUF5309 family protein [Candidatus Paceibacterota bacterium]